MNNLWPFIESAIGFTAGGGLIGWGYGQHQGFLKGANHGWNQAVKQLRQNGRLAEIPE